MSLLFVGPGRSMALGNNRHALYAPFPSGTSSVSLSTPHLTLTQAVRDISGWWDASNPGGLLGLNNAPMSAWNAPCRALIDMSASGRNLSPYFSQTSSGLPQGTPHLSGLLGGVGFPVASSGLLQPVLDPSAGWQIPSPTISATADWTLFLVWSRPNWRQGTNVDSNPIAILNVGSQTVLQLDSRGPGNRLVLFPGTNQVVASSSMTRRHTHSIVIRYSVTLGTDLWLDSVRVARSVPWSGGAQSGPVMLLHDGTPLGAAQCWFHEAADWRRALSDAEVLSVMGYARRWALGTRKGLYFIVNGQSNAINYSMNDGAAALLARGVAWYTGALAYNVLATTGNQIRYTMQSGHGIYAIASAGYPGSFVMDPGDGSSPATWTLGSDGLAVSQAIAALPAEDVADVCGIVWPWNETDSLRSFGEQITFRAASLRFLSLLRAMLADSANQIPMVWWNAIPYGSSDGIMMHRQVVQSVASDPSNRVIIGNSQTSDSNARGSVWDPTTGIATGGDNAHRDSADNMRLAMLASPVVARGLIAAGYADSIHSLPDLLPKAGGPSIVHVYRQSPTILIITIVHDGGNDLKVPLQATRGIGFSVMDGGSAGNPGRIVPAISCQRLDATHLQVALESALQHTSSACQLYYPYGAFQIGRGNAVTDNSSAIQMPVGWDRGSDLGISWNIDLPLAATFSGITLSDVLGT
jgi:hypothetical protein